jgi:hypothetical protein
VLRKRRCRSGGNPNATMPAGKSPTGIESTRAAEGGFGSGHALVC